MPELSSNMAIDKTTGKGCAQSIVSKVITDRLIADGIMGKPIYRKYNRSICWLLKVVNISEPYVMMSKGDEKSAEKPLWLPSFIDAETWTKAVSKFRTSVELCQNVEQCFLPEIDEYVQNIPNEKLLSITRDFLIEHGVVNVPISQRAGKTFYFNENEIYSLDKQSSLFPYEKHIRYNLFAIRGKTCFNMRVWQKAVSRFEVGMTLNECISLFLSTELEHRLPQELSPVEKLIQYISPPVYERVPENKDESTFDRIRITVGLPRYRFSSWETLQNKVEAQEMTMGEFISLAAQDELHPRSPELDPELQAEVMAYLEDSDITVDEFIAMAIQNELHPLIPGIDDALEAEIQAYLEENEMDIGDFIANAAQNELHPKTHEPEVNSMEKEPTRTLAFQVPESLYQRVNAYKQRHQITLRKFVLGLIEEELENDEDLVRKQQEDARAAEDESHDEDLSEDDEAPVSEDSPEVEQEDEPEETAAVGDFEGGSDEQDEGELEQDEPPDTAGDEEEISDLHEDYPDRGYVEGELGAAVEVAPMPDFGEEDGPAFPEPDDEEEQDYGGMEMSM